MVPKHLSDLDKLRREFVQTLGSRCLNGKGVGEKQTSDLLFVNDVHLKREYHTRLIYQFACPVMQEAIFGSPERIRRNLWLMTRIRAEHTLKKAPVEIVTSLFNDLGRANGISATLSRVESCGNPVVPCEDNVKHLLELGRR